MIIAGWAYTPYFLEYLDGVQNELALRHVPNVAPRQDWLAGPYGRRADKVPSLAPPAWRCASLLIHMFFYTSSNHGSSSMQSKTCGTLGSIRMSEVEATADSCGVLTWPCSLPLALALLGLQAVLFWVSPAGHVVSTGGCCAFR